MKHLCDLAIKKEITGSDKSTSKIRGWGPLGPIKTNESESETTSQIAIFLIVRPMLSNH